VVPDRSFINHILYSIFVATVCFHRSFFRDSFELTMDEDLDFAIALSIQEMERRDGGSNSKASSTTANSSGGGGGGGSSNGAISVRTGAFDKKALQRDTPGTPSPNKNDQRPAASTAAKSTSHTGSSASSSYSWASAASSSHCNSSDPSHSQMHGGNPIKPGATATADHSGPAPTPSSSSTCGSGASVDFRSMMSGLMSSFGGSGATSENGKPFRAGGLFPCCGGCDGIIGSGRVLTAMGRQYHENCFKCGACGQSISGGSFVKNSEDPSDTHPYHQECYSQLFSPTCCVCSNSLPQRFLRHSFFKNFVYCVSHEAPSTRHCFVCSRLEPVDALREPFQELPDGRVECLECISMAVLDSNECQPIYQSVVDFMEHQLGLRIPPGMRQVPVLAVDIPTLNDQKQNSVEPFHRTNNNIPTRPVTIQYGESITRGLTISSRSSIRHYVPFLNAPNFLGNMLAGGSIGSLPFEMFQSSEEVREVSAVLVLVGKLL
jgi:hypothetical protein